MKFTINQKELEKALEITSNVAAKKVVNPALQGALLTVNNNILEIQSSDSEVFLSIKISCESQENGKILVRTSLFKDIVKNFASPFIDLSLNGSTLHLTSGETRYKAQLNTLSLEDFPSFPSEMKDDILFSLPSSEFKAMLHKTIPFAAKDDIRPTFNSIFFDKDDIEFRLISSDTKRLALTKEFLTQTQGSFHFLIPLKTATILENMFSKSLPVDLSINNNMVTFSYGNMVLISNQIDGNFPDYRNVIPNETPFILTLSKEEFLGTLKTLSPFYNGDSQKLTLTINSGEIIFETEKTEMGEANNNMKIDYQGESLSIAFNYKFLQEILGIIEDSTFIMKLSAQEKPAIFQGSTKPNDLFVCVPMKL
jgi:DNA polymerase-3 subunit beta